MFSLQLMVFHPGLCHKLSVVLTMKFQRLIEINQSIVNQEPLNVNQPKLILTYKGKIGDHTLPKQEVVTLVFTGAK